MSFFRLELAALTLLATTLAPAQTAQMPRDYRGVQIHIDGIFVTPIPNAPFTAKVDIISHEILPDGSINIRTTINHVARSSSGRIYNERRQLVPATFKGEPRLLSGHIYDPSNRLNIFYDPLTRLARENYPAAASTASRQRSPQPNSAQQPLLQTGRHRHPAPRRSHPHRHS